VVFTGSGNLGNLTSRGITADATNYYAIGGGLMAGMIVGLTTLVGFDSAANLAEEAKDPFRSVPRAIVASVVAAGVLGLLFLIALTVAIKDIPAVSTGGSPVAAIIRSQLGPVAERILLLGIVFAMFGAGMVVMTAASRQGLRDGARRPLPGARADATDQPPHANPGPSHDPDPGRGRRPDGRASRRGIDAADRRRNDPARTHLRRHRGALPGGAQAARAQGGRIQPRTFRTTGRPRRATWVAAALFVLVTPTSNAVPALVVVGLILVGGLYFAYMMVFNREALDAEEAARHG
jgi:hypothetical protein